MESVDLNLLRTFVLLCQSNSLKRAGMKAGDLRERSQQANGQAKRAIRIPTFRAHHGRIETNALQQIHFAQD